MPLAYLLRRFYTPEVNGRVLLQGCSLVRYLGSFVMEIIASNLDPAYRVLHPSMPINPEVVDIKLELSNETAIAIIANSITLTPGTLVIDHLQEENMLRIHCLNYQGQGDVRKTVRTFETYLRPVLGDT